VVLEANVGKKIACLGDSSNHGGTLISTNQDGRLTVKDIQVCVNGCSHSCPIPGHGVTSVTAVAVKSFDNNQLIITEGAQAGCGAVITPPDRQVYVE
jgi:uncharacterized Zn-binding protein involved in type VI secretion